MAPPSEQPGLPEPLQPRQLAAVVISVSAALLCFEICLMRLLLVAGWHHFASLVISVALLGFGASGTLLWWRRAQLLAQGNAALALLVAATAFSMPTCWQLAQHVTVESRLLPVLMWRQLAGWLVYWALLGLPFLLGASTIGLALLHARAAIARVYAANLIGSAAGVVAAAAAMSLVPPAWLPALSGTLATLGLLALRHGTSSRVRLTCALALASVVALLAADPPRIRVDPYKQSAYVQRLEAQASAKRVAVVHGPRASVEAFSGDVFHDMPFLSMGISPPAMISLLVDGHRAGSLLRIDDADAAHVVDRTLMALPYALIRFQPRVLLLGELGGANIWLAKRHEASAITVVQPLEAVFDLLRGPLRELGGAVLTLPEVNALATHPRHFVDHSREHFDLIQLVSLESSAAGSGGVGGLAQDHLITVEGMGACLARLTERGVLTACRGIQSPPRDNLKLLATLAAALRDRGITDPAPHVITVRDYLGVCTLVRLKPWQAGDIARLRAACAERQLTPVWFPGIEQHELNRPDALPGPPGEPGDWFHHGARRLLSADAERFVAAWPFDIRPPTDRRPYFLDFCRLASLNELRAAFGDLWLTRVELAFAFVLAATLVVAVVGALLTLLPLALRRGRLPPGGRAATFGYAAAIGLGYLLLEMTLLSELHHLIGDPVIAAAVTIGALLAASGLGGLHAARLDSGRGVPLARAVIGLVAIALVLHTVLPALSGWGGAAPLVLRCAIAIAVVAPLGWLMGFPMPSALARLERAAPELIPWVWGINGFASVLAAPLATIIGMAWGFDVAGAAALALYLIAAALFAHLPPPSPGVTEPPER